MFNSEVLLNLFRLFVQLVLERTKFQANNEQVTNFPIGALDLSLIFCVTSTDTIKINLYHIQFDPLLCQAFIKCK